MGLLHPPNAGVIEPSQPMELDQACAHRGLRYRLSMSAQCHSLFSGSTERVYTATWVPTSTTRPVGIWKKSVASLAELAKPMKSRSCQPGIPECGDGFNERRERKNDVDMMSKCRPCLRAIASAFGTFGDSMNPKRSATRLNRSEIGVISTRSSSSVRGVSAVTIVRMMFCSCSTLLCLRLCSSEAGAKSGSLVRNTAVPGTICGGRFSRLRISASIGTSIRRVF